MSTAICNKKHNDDNRNEENGMTSQQADNDNVPHSITTGTK